MTASCPAAYLTYAPDLGLPGAADRVRGFAAAAVAQGVRRLVLLSGRGQHDHDLAERAVQESGAEWTVVRSAWFAQIERATGRPVRYLPASEQDFTTEMRRAGEPDELVAVLTEVLAELRDGRNASLGDGVQRALGRSPRDFAAFARAAAADGAWTPHALTHSYLCCGSTGADPVIQLRAYGRVRISQPAR